MQLQRVATETHLAQKLGENLGLPSLSTAKTRSSNKSIIELYKTDLKPLLAIFGTAMRATFSFALSKKKNEETTFFPQVL